VVRSCQLVCGCISTGSIGQRIFETHSCKTKACRVCRVGKVCRISTGRQCADLKTVRLKCATCANETPITQGSVAEALTTAMRCTADWAVESRVEHGMMTSAMPGPPGLLPGLPKGLSNTTLARAGPLVSVAGQLGSNFLVSSGSPSGSIFLVYIRNPMRRRRRRRRQSR
jgi:hypothetical protein